MVAASSVALSRVTSTLFLASSADPRAIVIADIVGRATGIADTSRITARGMISTTLMPLAAAKARPIARREQTITSSHMTTLEVTRSICCRGLADWTKGTDSPVRDDWSTSRVPSATLTSAGRKSPPRRRTTSPGTISRAGATSHCPSLLTRAWTLSLCLSASSAALALSSWTKPSPALKNRSPSTR